MHDVSLFRLHCLRALYLLVVVGTGVNVWPDLVHHDKWSFFEGVVACMLTAFSLLCIVGLRYPLRMLPVLLWEVAWKTLWLGLVALPQWWAGHIDPAIEPTLFACSFVVLFYVGIPWRYVLTHYAMTVAEPWRPTPVAGATPNPAPQ